EYVSTLLLNALEYRQGESVEYRYDWGLRSEKEFVISPLQHMDFTVDYGIAMGVENEENAEEHIQMQN
ncbi:unnamed protein product, partial [Allacma fusca]